MSEHCGTPEGYRQHKANRKSVCEPCSAHGPATPLTAAELIEEIQRLLNYGEGEQRIITAVGYEGRTKSLKDRLRKNGRADLNERIFWNEVAA